MLPAFEYLRPRSLNSLLLAIEQSGRTIIAGGQGLLPALAEPEGPRPSVLVDIGGIPALKGLTRASAAIVIGAATTLADIVEDGLSYAVPTLLLRAVAGIANPAIRNRATIGGNIAQGDPRSELPACLAVLGATLDIVSVGGARTVSAERFFSQQRSARLDTGELVARIAVPIESERNPTALIKIVRQAEGFATIGVAALRSSTAESRLAFFGLNKAAWLLPGTARALDRNGWAQDSAIVEAKLREELAEFDELLPDPYRLHIAGVLLSRLCRGIGWE